MPTRTLVHSYKPRGIAKDLFFNRAPELLIAGPAGTGKSLACLEKLHTMCLLTPGMRAIIIRKTLTSLGSTGLVTYRHKVAAEALASGDVHWYGGSPQEAAQYRYSNGSTITVGGMDKSIRIMSSEYDLAYVQEATELTENDWEAITTRLRNWRVSFQQLIADCNPDVPTHWLKERTRRGTTVLLESRHEDNPALYDERYVQSPDGTERIEYVLTEGGAAYINKLDNLTGVRYLRLRKGLWVAAEGQIYEDFDPAVHLTTIDEIRERHGGWENTRLCARGLPWEWTRWWSIDFGFTNPMVIQRWAEDDDGRLYLYAEQYMTRRLVEDHVEDLKAQVFDDAGNWVEPAPRAILADHDAEDRATFHRKFGRGTAAAQKKVKPGIQSMQSRFKVQPDGKARIYFVRDALWRRDPELADAKKPTCTIEELPGYVWKPGTKADPVKEEPVKEDDHGCDASRYLCAHRDNTVKPRIRVMGGR